MADLKHILCDTNTDTNMDEVKKYAIDGLIKLSSITTRDSWTVSSIPNVLPSNTLEMGTDNISRCTTTATKTVIIRNLSRYNIDNANIPNRLEERLSLPNLPYHQPNTLPQNTCRWCIQDVPKLLPKQLPKQLPKTLPPRTFAKKKDDKIGNNHPVQNVSAKKDDKIGNNHPKKSIQKNQQKTVVRRRKRKTQFELETLNSVYKQNKLPNSDEKFKLALQLNCSVDTIRIWFQNRRAREKRNAKKLAENPVKNTKQIDQLMRSGMF